MSMKFHLITELLICETLTDFESDILVIPCLLANMVLAWYRLLLARLTYQMSSNLWSKLSTRRQGVLVIKFRMVLI